MVSVCLAYVQPANPASHVVVQRRALTSSICASLVPRVLLGPVISDSKAGVRP